MDWHAWHDLYRDRAPLKRRLRLVRAHLGRALNEAPPGEIPILSICAGDARDLCGALASHRRAGDIRADLLEVNPQLIAQGTRELANIAKPGQFTYHQTDATLPDAYSGRSPAGIVLACGMLGLVAAASTPGLVKLLSAVLRPGGMLIWTRSLYLRAGQDHLAQFGRLLSENAFREVKRDLTGRGFLAREVERFVVGSHRYEGKGTPLPTADRLFEIADL